MEKLGILLADRKLVTIFYPMLLLEREFIWFCEKGEIKSEKALKREFIRFCEKGLENSFNYYFIVHMLEIKSKEVMLANEWFVLQVFLDFIRLY